MGNTLPHGHPARRPRRWRMVLTLTAAGLFVCCVGAAGLGAWNFQHVRRSSGEARDTAEVFLRDVASGDTSGAYDMLCPDTRERWSRDEFVQRLAVPPTIVTYAIEDVEVATDQGTIRGTVTAKLTKRSGAVDRREMPMIKDGEHWQVCGDPF